MSHSQFHSIKSFILRHAWLNLWDKHMTTGRINQVTIFSTRRPHGQPSLQIVFIEFFSLETDNIQTLPIKREEANQSLDSTLVLLSWRGYRWLFEALSNKVNPAELLQAHWGLPNDRTLVFERQSNQECCSLQALSQSNV